MLVFTELFVPVTGNCVNDTATVPSNYQAQASNTANPFQRQHSRSLLACRRHRQPRQHTPQAILHLGHALLQVLHFLLHCRLLLQSIAAGTCWCLQEGAQGLGVIQEGLKVCLCLLQHEGRNLLPHIWGRSTGACGLHAERCRTAGIMRLLARLTSQ